jgi:hypothetical protein
MVAEKSKFQYRENLNIKDFPITHKILDIYHNKPPVQEEI